MKDNITPWKEEWEEHREIAQGGQGIVTELKHKVDPERRAVLKRILTRWREDPQARERLQQEIETLSKLHSLGARVPAVYDSFQKYDNAEPFLVMEFIKGVRFDKWLKTSTPVTPAKAVIVTSRIADTIKLCHQKEIGHRDLKPANIILKNGEINSPYILDFGIAFDSRQTVILTREGEMFWNEFIILPECQDLEGGHRDLRSDITALAGIFFNCLTGKSPIMLRNAQELAPHQRDEDLLMNSAETAEQGERLIWFFDRAFSYRIDKRFQNLDEFMIELERFEESPRVENMDLFEQFNIFDKSVQATDRNVQLSALRKKYMRLPQKINQQIEKDLNTLRHHRGQPSQINININSIENRNIPNNIGELLDKKVHAFTLGREDFKLSAVVVIASFGVGMQIHLYSASYCAHSNNLTKPLKPLMWSKIAIIDENTTDLSDKKLTIIVNAIKSMLTSEIRNLIPKK